MDVTIWQQAITIPTYKAGAPDKNPMFFENRVYQGSTGVVYPNRIIEKVEDEKVDETYLALFLENKYLKIMILSELGGRVQLAYDKIAGRHFVYYNQVIKPALVGLCGPWISGGIEFNWPQHHRPSTFEKIDFTLQENSDGSKTVWVSEVEKMFHTKGMAGFTLHPDKAYLEIKVQLYNPTPMPQTFLWWANPAVSVNDRYQTVFPPDVHAVFDHGRRDVCAYPIARGTYYKVDYSPGTDISRYSNIPVPTSFMAVGSDFDFVGGYEHDTGTGMLHVADHHVSPGKKQWTWGNGDFGKAWERNLTDVDGPYIELMTGVYTDNQPDFSWIMPMEEKSFTQYFLPYRKVGLVKNASSDLLLGLDEADGHYLITVFATSAHLDLRITLTSDEHLLLDEKASVSPETIYRRDVPLAIRTQPLAGDKPASLVLTVKHNGGRTLLSYVSRPEATKDLPPPARPALPPAEINTNEELFLTGQHLEQYRHATFSPLPYYEEALRRDPDDIRSNNAMGVLLLRRGRFTAGEAFLRCAVDGATMRNPNPYDSEPYYNLGVCLFYQQRYQEAYEAFSKAAWSGAWQDSACLALAQIDVRNQDYEKALGHINWSIDKNTRSGKAYLVKTQVLRKLGKLDEAIDTAELALRHDLFNVSVLFELHYCLLERGNTAAAAGALDRLAALSRGNAHTLTSYATDYAALGLYAQAIELLRLAGANDSRDPMLNYHIAWYAHQHGEHESCLAALAAARSAQAISIFPNRLEDIAVLQFAVRISAGDARAHYLLGNLWYDKRQYEEAISCWQQSAWADEGFPTAFRNLAIATYNKLKDPQAALALLEKAYRLDLSDARVLMELDQLYKRLNHAPVGRLKLLENNPIAALRDDLYLEIAALNNFIGDYQKAYEMIMNRQFHPWEGGEGKVSAQYVYSLTELAKQDMGHKKYKEAISKLEQAQSYPFNLGEGRLYGARENELFFWLGCAFEALGDHASATRYFEKASIGLVEPYAAIFYNDQQPDKIFYQGLAFNKLGDPHRGPGIFEDLVRFGIRHQHNEVALDYFAVSLPDLMIFDGDLGQRNFLNCTFLAGLGYMGLGLYDRAQRAFDTVLTGDAMHLGAQKHLRLLNTFVACGRP